MKKFVIPFLVLFGLVCLAGCEDEPFIKADPTSVSFSQEGGTQTINLSTNSISWQATVSGKGFSVSPSSGSGNATLQLKASPATSSSDVTGTLTVKSGTMQTSVSITQSAKSTFVVKGTNTVEHEGGSYTLTLEHNTSYTVEVEAQAKSWIQYTGTRAMSTATLEFLIASNPGAPRSGKVEIRDPEGKAQTQAFVFEQKESPLRADLMKLYTSLQGENWNSSKKTNWNTNEPLETWGGVTIEKGSITGLNLNGFALKGVLPSALGNLTTLKEIDLGHNPGLTGPLPRETGNLTSLEILRANHTSLDGPLPASMGNLNKLKELLLYNTYIEGPIPQDWAGMVSLEQFDASGAALKGPLPKNIFTEWKHLSVFKLNDNTALGGPLPVELGQLKTTADKLRLYLYNCSFEGGIPEAWEQLPDVCDVLLLYGNKLTEPVPLPIQNHASWTADKWDSWVNKETHAIRTQQNDVFLDLEKVPDAQRECLMALYDNLDGKNWTKGKYWGTDTDIDQWEGVIIADSAIVGLHLSGFGLRGTLPACVGYLTSLKVIDLSNNPQLTGTLPAELEQLSNLTLLEASATGLTGPLPKGLGNLKKLTELRLDHTQINGTIPKEWAGMTALSVLGISHTNLSGPLPDALFEGWKNLQVLLLSNNPNLTGSLPQALGNLTTSAQELDIYLHECNFTGSVPSAWGNLPRAVRRLSVYGNKLTGTIPAALIEHPNWEIWDAHVNNTQTHYLRTQQNGVYLDLEHVLPTVGAVSVTELTHNKINASAAIQREGSHKVTERGFMLNATKRRVGSGMGSFSATFTDLSENTTYTLKAYAVSQAGTAYGPETVVTTPLYNQLVLALKDDKNQAVTFAKVYLKRLPDQPAATQMAATAARTPSAARTTIARTFRPGNLYQNQEELLQDVAVRLAQQLKPYRAEIQRNLERLKTSRYAVQPSTRGAVAFNAGAEETEYSLTSSVDGRVQVENIEPGLYGVRVAEAYGLIDNFYSLITVEAGRNNLSLDGIPSLSPLSSTLSLFRQQAGIRPFASPVANDNIVALVSMDKSYVSQYKGKVLENVLLCPADTTSSMVIIADSREHLEEIYEAFLDLPDVQDSTSIKMDLDGIMKFLAFIRDLAQRIVFTGPMQANKTNLVLQQENSLKYMMLEGFKNSEHWETIKNAIKDLSYVIKLTDKQDLVLNMIMVQQGNHPVLMTDGDGPPVAGGNMIVLGSDYNLTLQDLGYHGNWHLGVTVK